ncbi:PEP-CTERM sorting domain-containing protein [Phycisphaeraceae bacterium D3-23]
MIELRHKAGLLGLSFVTASLLAGHASAQRLFGTANGVDGIFELDPVNGTIINNLANSPAGSALDGLAFDGTSLWYLGAAPDTLYRLDPTTGDTLDTFALPSDPDGSGGSEDPDNGDTSIRGALAYLNGMIYITQWDRPVQDIEVFDPTVGEVVRTIDFDSVNPGARLFGNSGLAAITGPNQLIVSTALSQQLYFVNPITGVIEETLDHNQFGVLGIAVVGDELYLGSDQLGSIGDGVETVHVYNRDGEQLRFFNFDNATNIYSLAGDHTAIPEPGSAALLALGALALTRRRRR